MENDVLKLSTIAVAMELSETEPLALKYAQKLARLHHATIVLVHMIDPVGYAFPKGIPDLLAINQDGKDELNAIEENIRRQGIAVRSVVENGIILERILRVLVEQQVDLLILGTKATTETGRIALGTIARQMLTKTPCPILTITPDSQAHLRWAGHWRRILVATDFSAPSISALRVAQRIAHSELAVLNATNCTAEDVSHSIEQLRLLAPFNESHTVPVEHVVIQGDAAKIITEYASNFHPDLIVLGSPTNELAAEDFYMSTTLQVISQVRCPVLCMPCTTGTPDSAARKVALAC
jgi:nucleotide-binding universal stress UspA family protein